MSPCVFWVLRSSHAGHFVPPSPRARRRGKPIEGPAGPPCLHAVPCTGASQQARGSSSAKMGTAGVLTISRKFSGRSLVAQDGRAGPSIGLNHAVSFGYFSFQLKRKVTNPTPQGGARGPQAAPPRLAGRGSVPARNGGRSPPRARRRAACKKTALAGCCSIIQPCALRGNRRTQRRQVDPLCIVRIAHCALCASRITHCA